MKEIYNKLIRDKIPEYIKSINKMPVTRKLNEKEFFLGIKKKILEEAKELREAKGKKNLLNEIVDIYEILEALEKYLKITKSEVKFAKKEKIRKRGAFKKRLFLIEVNS